jgi:hypothetical protein
MGQSVTVMVKVNGQFVERVVRPEECVGERETPVVSCVQFNVRDRCLIDLFIPSAGNLGPRYSIKSTYTISIICLR